MPVPSAEEKISRIGCGARGNEQGRGPAHVLQGEATPASPVMKQHPRQEAIVPIAGQARTT